MTPQEFRVRLALIVGFGVVLRVLYTVFVAPWPPEVSDDQVFFNLMPRLLADGHGFIQPQLFLAGETRVTAAHPPFYSVLLAGPAALGLDHQLFQRLTGTVFGAGTIVAIAYIARRLAGNRSALIAAALAAVYPILITADGALMAESLFGLLVAGALLLGYRLFDSPSLGLAVAIGALVGVAALTRGEALLLLPLIFLPTLRRPGGLRTALVAGLAMVVVLAPWTIRNFVVFDRPVLVSTDAGAVIGGANCETTYYGENIGGWNIFCDRPWPGHNEAEETSRQFRDGVSYAADNPLRLPVVAAVRLARAWSFFLPWQTNPGRSELVQNIGVVMYFLLLPLGVAGFFILRRRGVSTWLVMVPVLQVCIMAVLIYGFLRFRHPAEISLVVLAGVTLDRLVGAVGSRYKSTPPVSSGGTPRVANSRRRSGERAVLSTTTAVTPLSSMKRWRSRP